MAEATNKPVVDPVKMPKIKTNAKTLAHLNTWAIALSSFLGFFLIFAAISSFTKEWAFMPALKQIIPFGATNSTLAMSVPYTLFLALAALGFGLYGIITISKITDAEALKKAWKNVSKLMFSFVAIYTVYLVALIIGSLVLIGVSGKTYYKDTQKIVWLYQFLPSFLMCLAAGGIAFLAKTIADGKTANARVASFIGIGISAVAFILMFIALMVSIYGN